MQIMGRTISFAGNPSRNPSRITPSSPMNCAGVSRSAAQCAKMEPPPIWQLVKHQITAPAGAAARQALPSTKIVRSSSERTSTLPNWGLRYGGSSSVKEDGTPRRMVCDSRRDTANVTKTPSRISPSSNRAELTERHSPLPAAKNREIQVIMVGNLPLQGIKLLVRMAISRSRGESIMRQPVTPAALQPKPMHMVSPCLPQAQAR